MLGYLGRSIARQSARRVPPPPVWGPGRDSGVALTKQLARNFSMSECRLRVPGRPLLRIQNGWTHHGKLYSTKIGFNSTGGSKGPKPNVDGSVLRGGFLKVTAKVLAILIAVPVGYFAVFFAYDSTTYEDGPLGVNVDIPIAALNLPTGGPKNLPIADAFIDDVQLHQNKDRPRLVILGTGWAANALLKEIDKDKYNITVISPTNHFLITPLLPSAAVGTMRLTSLVEPIRATCARVDARFIEGGASDILFDEKLVEVRTEDENRAEKLFYVPYDKVVIAAGAKSNTHGVPGLEHCYFFKSAIDVMKLRQALNHSFEVASLPTTTEEERKRLLSFVVCGGGPTGVELASEIFDLLKEDLGRNYPKALVNHASVHIVQSRSAILNTYDQNISEYAMKKFMKNGISLHTNSRVEEVKDDAVVFNQVGEDGKKERYELPYGICIWTTGIALTRLTQKVMERLKDSQHNRHALETDAHLRVIGAPSGEVYAAGDCSSLRTDLASDLEYYIKRDFKEQNLDSGKIRVSKAIVLLHELARRDPQAGQHIHLMHEKLRRRYDPEEELSLNEVVDMLKHIDKKVVSLPATAQRAHQQGTYLAKKLNRLADVPSSAKDTAIDDHDASLYPAFHYKHYGSLAYIPNEALFDAKGFTWLNGIVAMYIWRGVYWLDGPSNRSRASMVYDWISRAVFGRDMVLLDRFK